MKAKLIKSRGKIKILFNKHDPILDRVYSYDKKTNTCNLDVLVIKQLKQFFKDKISFEQNILDAFETYEAKIEKMHNPNQEDLDEIVSKLPNIPLSTEQVEAIHFFNIADDVILGDTPGVGKTLSTLAYAEYHNLQKVLIVSPAMIKTNWQGELKKWGIKGEVIVCPGNYKDNTQLLNNSKDIRFVVVNYEMLDPEKYPQLFKEWDIIFFDESHYLKNRNAARTKAAKKLKAGKKIYMSGTALTNDAGDLWSILNMIDPKRFTSYWTFVRYFANIVDDGFGDKPVGYNKAHAGFYQYLLKKYMIRRSKEIEAKQIYQQHFVKFDKDQRELYKEAKNNWTYGINTILTPAEKSLRLDQISNDPMIVGLQCDSAVNDKVLELLRGKTKTIVGVCYVEHGIHLEKFLKNNTVMTIYRIDGKTKTAKRDSIVNEFKTCKRPCVLVATCTSIAEGISVDECNHMILAGRSYKEDKNMQFECRIYRPQTTTQDKYYDVIVPEQIGLIKNQGLSMKRQMILEILDGKKPTNPIGDVAKWVEKQLQEEKYDCW